jgi:putative PEP-CTERM system TPR-repeat lipoprotein
MPTRLSSISVVKVIRSAVAMTPNIRSMKIAVHLGAIATLLLLTASCGQNSPEKLMASAKEYLAKGDRSAAVIQLKNLLAKNPDQGEARLLLGQAMFEAEDFASAEKELGRALELKQPQEKVLPPYVQALVALGKYKEVVVAVERHKLYDPTAVAATQAALGDAFSRLGDRVRAKEAYDAALAAVPGLSRARLGQAKLAAANGQLDEALSRTDEVIAAEPKLAEALVFRAQLLLAKGDRENGRKALEETIAASDRFVPARLALIGLLIENGDSDAATKLIEGTRKVAPNELRVDYLEALLAYRLGELERARQRVQLVLKYVPNQVASIVLAGAIELRARQYQGAEIHLSRAVAQAPNHVGARQLLAQTYLRMGEPGKARNVLLPLLERGMPTNSPLLLLAGEVALANGDMKQADAYFRAAATRGTPGGAARIRLGQIAIASGRVDEGFTELEIASELDSGLYQADLAIIVAHLQRNELDKAQKAVQTLEKKQPKNPLTFHMHGVTNLARGDVASARRAFEKALELQPNFLPAAQNLARIDLNEQRPDDARRRYEAMSAKDPGNEQVHMALAELLTQTGAPAKEIQATLQRAIAANSQAAIPRIALINFQLRVGDIAAALTTAQAAMAAMPKDVRVLDAVGSAQEAGGQVNQAIETYTRLAALQPNASLPLYRLATLYAREKDTEKAIETLRRARRIAPNERDVVPQLVRAYMLADRVDEALAEARGLQRREPKFAGGYSLEGDIHLARDRHDDAVRAYREALRLEPKANATAIRLHRALAARGSAAEADAWAKAWLARHPADPAMRLYLAERELTARNLKAAAVHYQALIATNPKNAVALNNLASISGELGDPKALSYAERAVKLAPNSPALLDTYGMLLVKSGDPAKGLPQMERALELAPGRLDLRLNYARALIEAGRKAEARRELEVLSKAGAAFAGSKDAAELLKKL